MRESYTAPAFRRKPEDDGLFPRCVFIARLVRPAGKHGGRLRLHQVFKLRLQLALVHRLKKEGLNCR
jgi:hypothetical protein